MAIPAIVFEKNFLFYLRSVANRGHSLKIVENKSPVTARVLCAVLLSVARDSCKVRRIILSSNSLHSVTAKAARSFRNWTDPEPARVARTAPLTFPVFVWRMKGSST